MEAESAGTPLGGTAPWGGPPWPWGGCSSITWGGWGAPGCGGGAAVTPVWTWACRERNSSSARYDKTFGDPLSKERCKVVQALKWDSVSPDILPG